MSGGGVVLDGAVLPARSWCGVACQDMVRCCLPGHGAVLPARTWCGVACQDMVRCCLPGHGAVLPARTWCGLQYLCGLRWGDMACRRLEWDARAGQQVSAVSSPWGDWGFAKPLVKCRLQQALLPLGVRHYAVFSCAACPYESQWLRSGEAPRGVD